MALRASPNEFKRPLSAARAKTGLAFRNRFRNICNNPVYWRRIARKGERGKAPKRGFFILEIEFCHSHLPFRCKDAG